MYKSLDDADVIKTWRHGKLNEGDKSPFTTHNWVAAWSKAYEDSIDSLNIIVGGDIESHMVLPLSLKGQLLSPVCTSATDYFDARGVYDKDLIAACVARALVIAKSNRARLVMASIPPEALLLKGLDEICRLTSEVQVKREMSRQINLSLVSESQDLLSHDRRRTYIKRRRQLALRDACLEVSTPATAEDTKVALALHAKRWQARGVRTSFQDIRREKFISHLLADHNIRTVMFKLKIGHEELIAFRFGFLDRATYYDWWTSFDLQYQGYSPGFVLLGRSVDWLIGEGIGKFDFLRGDERYKSSWANEYKFLTTVELH